MVVVDYATPTSHLVKIVVETVRCHREHANDFARWNLAYANGDRRARHLPIEPQHRVVGREKTRTRSGHGFDALAADPLGRPTFGLRKAQP